MSLSHHLPFMPAIVSLMLLARVETSPTVSAGGLDPYRTFVRSPAASRLLAIARAAMTSSLRPPGNRLTDEAPPEEETTKPRPANPDGVPDTTLSPRRFPASGAEEPDWPAAPVGVYVSLLSGRETRACVGSATPMRGTLSETVRVIAVEALHSDPRRPPVRRTELPDLRLVISFVSEGERLKSPFEIDPGREGLLVATARGTIAFLPGEARTVQWALREARRARVLTGSTPNAVYRRLDVVTVSEPTRKPEHDDRER